MKKYVWPTLGLAAVMALLWWGNEFIKQPVIEFFPMVCIDSHYYVETEEVIAELPEGWTEAGEIAASYPITQGVSRHLDSNCCGVGCKVFVPPRESVEVYAGIYTQQDDGTYLYHEFLPKE